MAFLPGKQEKILIKNVNVHDVPYEYMYVRPCYETYTEAQMCCLCLCRMCKRIISHFNVLFICLFFSWPGASLNYNHFGLTSCSLATSSYEWHSFSLLSAFVKSQRLSILHSDVPMCIPFAAHFQSMEVCKFWKHIEDNILSIELKRFPPQHLFSTLPCRVWFKPHSILFLQSHQWCKIPPLLILA